MEYQVVNLDRQSVLADRIRLAGTSEARRRGLLGVEELAKESGVWLSPCEAIHTFGMKMRIDVFFVGRDLRIRKLCPNLAPRRLSVCLSAASVIELQAGAIGRTGSQVGDQLRFHPSLGH